MDLRNLILAAGDAALEIEKAKANLEEARARVETAKAAVTEANAAYDKILSECEEAGLVRSKVRKAVEELKQAFITAGLISETQNTQVAADDADKPRRKRRSKGDDVADVADPVSEIAESTTTPVAVEVKADSEREVVSTEAPVEEATTQHEIVAEPEVAGAESQASEMIEQTEVLEETTDVEEVSPETAPETTMVDNSEIVSDITEIIAEAVAKSGSHLTGNEEAILLSELDAAADAATSENYVMDIDYYRAHLASRQAVLGEVASAFIRVIGAIEAGEKEVPALFPAEDKVDDDILDSDDKYADEAVEENDEPYIEDERFGGEEEHSELEIVEVSDDEIIAHEAVEQTVAVVENIDSMNFLEEAPAADAKGAEAVSNAEEVEEEKPAKKPFAAPAFLMNRK